MKLTVLEIIWKNICFSVPIKKECDNGKIITYNLKFIGRFRFMSTSLSEVADNTSGIFNSIECKSCIEKKIIQNAVLLD